MLTDRHPGDVDGFDFSAEVIQGDSHQQRRCQGEKFSSSCAEFRGQLDGIAFVQDAAVNKGLAQALKLKSSFAKGFVQSLFDHQAEFMSKLKVFGGSSETCVQVPPPSSLREIGVLSPG